MAHDLAGRTVVVTGGASGQGAEEAAALVAAGAHVVAVDVSDREGRKLAACLNGPGRADFRHLDVTSEDDWRTLAGELGTAGRTVHGLVNNAGIPQRSRIGDVDRADWDRAVAVNMTGPMLGIQALLPLMAEGSSVVNVGSVAALGAHHGAAYTASKWGLRGLTRTAATELGPRGIRVNIIHPGYVETPLTATAPPAFTEAHLRITPLGRPGTVGEIAEAVLFLLDAKSSYITGAELAVDGGFSAHGGQKATSDAAREAQ